MRRLLLAALAPVALAGCDPVGPNYTLPDAALVNDPAANAPLMGAAERAVSADPAADRWWQLYRDERLDGFVRQALDSNTDLRVAAANINRAQAAVAAAKNGELPQTAIEAGFEYSQLSGEQYLLPVPIPSQGLYDMDITISYQLDLFGQIKRGIEAAKADEAAARAASDVVRITIVADTVRSYVGACSAGHELAVARHSFELQRRNNDLTQRLLGAGRATALDLTRSQAQVEQFRANIPQLEAEQRVSLYRLAVLTGRPPADFPKELSTCAAEPVLAQPIPVGDGMALLKRRPDLREAERQLAGATARIGVATADLYPKVAFALTGGSIGSINDMFKDATQTYGIGPLISWDFPQQEGIRARIRGAEAGADAALAQFDGKVLSALREVESALTVYARDLDRESALKAARDRAAEAERQSDQLYRAGREDEFRTLDAERVLANADLALAQAETKVAADQVNLFLALGGGWETDETPGANPDADAARSPSPAGAKG
jgi:NodT family efflux transporter outer membrane factor (OMF) lipoprotein